MVISIIYLLCYLVSFLPLQLLYCISNLLSIILYYIVSYRKKVVSQNLNHVFPKKTKQECDQIKKAFYQHLSDLFFEHIKALTITPKLLLERVVVKDKEALIKFYQARQSIILVAGHFGNWEWIANALALETPYTICAGYQPLQNQTINRIVLDIRSRFQRKAIAITSLCRYIKSYKGPPQATTLLIDQAPFHKANSHTTTFLKQPTSITLTAAKLAHNYNQPIFYIQIDRSKRGTYIVKPILVTEMPAQLSAQAIAESYTKKLEEDILRNPAFWLWSHKRWK